MGDIVVVVEEFSGVVVVVVVVSCFNSEDNDDAGGGGLGRGGKALPRLEEAEDEKLSGVDAVVLLLALMSLCVVTEAEADRFGGDEDGGICWRVGVNKIGLM